MDKDRWIYSYVILYTISVWRVLHGMGITLDEWMEENFTGMKFCDFCDKRATEYDGRYYRCGKHVKLHDPEYRAMEDEESRERWKMNRFERRDTIPGMGS
jgi:hypothetical protein